VAGRERTASGKRAEESSQPQTSRSREASDPKLQIPIKSQSPTRTLTLHDRQHRRAVDLRLLRRMARTLLDDLLEAENFDLGIYLVAAAEMTRLNETFLRHQGPTDVIAFDYNEPVQTNHGRRTLRGEIFICVDEAVRQARRFGTSWQSEAVRYLVHGVLHLLGYDDLKPTERREMKREEARLLRQLARQFGLSKLALSKSVQRPRLSA